jgi:hypothetical protein
MSRGDGPTQEGDARLLARVGEGFRPTPLDDAGRARFDARLRERIAVHGTRRPALPTAAAAAAALLVLAIWAGGGVEAPQRTAVRPEAATAEASGWEQELFLAADEARAEDVEEGLPDEYVAIAHAFSTP